MSAPAAARHCLQLCRGRGALLNPLLVHIGCIPALYYKPAHPKYLLYKLDDSKHRQARRDEATSETIGGRGPTHRSPTIRPINDALPFVNVYNCDALDGSCKRSVTSLSYEMRHAVPIGVVGYRPGQGRDQRTGLIGRLLSPAAHPPNDQKRTPLETSNDTVFNKISFNLPTSHAMRPKRLHGRDRN